MEDIMIFKREHGQWKPNDIYEFVNRVDMEMINRVAETKGVKYTDNYITYMPINHDTVCAYCDIIGSYRNRELLFRKCLHDIKNQINVIVSLSFFEAKKHQDRTAQIINNTCQETIKSLDKFTETLNRPIYNTDKSISVLILTNDEDSLLISCLKDKCNLAITCVSERDELKIKSSASHYDVLFIDNDFDIMDSKDINVERVISLSGNSDSATLKIPPHSKLDDIYNLIIAPYSLTEN